VTQRFPLNRVDDADPLLPGGTTGTVVITLL
jgi:hypothetical protein